MHDPNCKSNIVLTTYPPIYPACDCGYVEPDIQGEHHPLCFPAIRDVRIGDWGPSCFTCEVLRMCESTAYANALRDAKVEVNSLFSAPTFFGMAVSRSEVNNIIDALSKKAKKGKI